MKKIRKTEPQEDSYERLRLLELIVTVPESRMPLIYDLYPEYFAASPRAGSLEYTSAVNSSYLKWIQDYDITRDWIREFPTMDIYNDYKKYCVENRLYGMDRKMFFAVLEEDFSLMESNQ